LSPTAAQVVALVHDTPSGVNTLPDLGLEVTDQAPPFQDSIRVWEKFVAFWPSATQLAAVTQDTLMSSPLLGTGMTDQAAPFQDSISVPSPG
jgi:hypothetical protein